MYLVKFFYGKEQTVECSTLKELESLIWGLVLAGIAILEVATVEEK